MSGAALKIEVPADFQEFAEERVRAGKAASVEQVVREAFFEKKLAAFRELVDAGLRDANEGRIAKGSPAEVMERLRTKHGIK